MSTDIQTRYGSAISSSNLRSCAETSSSDSDVLGAAGLAAKHSPLAISLMRLFVGGDQHGTALVEHMTRMLVGKAYRLKPPINEAGASIIARLVLDWHRDSACKKCGGHGFKLMTNAPSLSDKRCESCDGSGKRSFDDLFHPDRVDLATWLLVEVERETAIAGPLAMQYLAPRLDL